MNCAGINSLQVQQCLQAVDTQSILDSQSLCSETNCWWPVVNDFDLSEQPLANIEAGTYNQVRKQLLGGSINNTCRSQ